MERNFLHLFSILAFAQSDQEKLHILSQLDNIYPTELKYKNDKIYAGEVDNGEILNLKKCYKAILNNRLPEVLSKILTEYTYNDLFSNRTMEALIKLAKTMPNYYVLNYFENAMGEPDLATEVDFNNFVGAHHDADLYKRTRDSVAGGKTVFLKGTLCQAAYDESASDWFTFVQNHAFNTSGCYKFTAHQDHIEFCKINDTKCPVPSKNCPVCPNEENGLHANCVHWPKICEEHCQTPDGEPDNVSYMCIKLNNRAALLDLYPFDRLADEYAEENKLMKPIVSGDSGGDDEDGGEGGLDTGGDGGSAAESPATAVVVEPTLNGGNDDDRPPPGPPPSHPVYPTTDDSSDGGSSAGDAGRTGGPGGPGGGVDGPPGGSSVAGRRRPGAEPDAGTRTVVPGGWKRKSEGDDCYAGPTIVATREFFVPRSSDSGAEKCKSVFEHCTNSGVIIVSTLVVLTFLFYVLFARRLGHGSARSSGPPPASPFPQ